MALGVDRLAHDIQRVFDELLAINSRKLDVRELFQQLSAVVCQIVPHDEAQLVLLTEDRSPYLYIGTRDGGSEGVAGNSAATNLGRF